MKKLKINTKVNKGMHRYFLITELFLAITPIICYFYVSMLALNLHVTFQDMLVKDPNITIIFLIAMINPYIAYLIHLIYKKLETKDTTFVLINMFFLLIAQLLTMNVFYFMMLLYVFYKAINYYHVDVKKAWKSITIKQSFYCGGGSFLVIMLSSVCLYSTIRLM
ncbi:hypothetical protein [Anaerorhabdus sp.]|uniref:hypothetical protein n=1 Tax=Anaerorhabdus sp. TaxID=1872524 RepID=UPI002FCAA318